MHQKPVPLSATNFLFSSRIRFISGAIVFIAWVGFSPGSASAEDVALPEEGMAGAGATEDGVPAAESGETDLAVSPEGEMESESGPSPGPTEPRPRKHVVQKGDTLWFISSTYLIDPFYWPRIWEINRHIENPDLIYPGNVIFLPTPEFLEGLEAIPPPEEAPPGAPVAPGAPKKAPPAPVGPTFIEMVPEERELDPALLASAGYIYAKGLETSGSLIGVKDDKILIAEGDTVYIKRRGFFGRAFEPGDVLLPYRRVRKVYHPKTQQYMGYLVLVLGRLKVIGVERGIATAKVSRSYYTIYGEDPVALIEAFDLPNFDEGPAEGDPELEGYVVDVRQEKAIIAQFDVVYIDRGMKDGIGRGSSFKVIREGNRTSLFSAGLGVRLPSRTIGELEVITVGKRTATARVRKSSETIHRGDRIEILPNQ